MGSFPVMSTTANLNFMTMGGGGGCGGGGPGHLLFPGMFNGGSSLETNLDANGAKPRLPIWIHQNGNDSNLENPNNSSFLGSSSSNNNNGGMLPPEMVQWLNVSQEAVVGAPYTGLPLKEEEENKGEMQFNSLYNYPATSTAPPPSPPPLPPPHMSATALLQKAAQMGSTRTTNPRATSGFGLMTSSDLTNFNSSNQENSIRLMMMMTGLTQSKENSMIESGNRNLTRDFLGVGENERRSFNLQRELSKFTSSMENSSL